MFICLFCWELDEKTNANCPNSSTFKINFKFFQHLTAVEIKYLYTEQTVPIILHYIKLDVIVQEKTKMMFHDKQNRLIFWVVVFSYQNR